MDWPSFEDTAGSPLAGVRKRDAPYSSRRAPRATRGLRRPSLDALSEGWLSPPALVVQSRPGLNVKADEIKDYFEDWQENLARVTSLMEDTEYAREAQLVLSCYVGAFGSLRYQRILRKDGERYKRVVREYSGMRDFYEKIDLLFFVQWARSEFAENGEYKKLKSHGELARIVVAIYGDKDQIRNGTRYISPKEFMESVEQAPFQGFDRDNLVRYLPLFSLCEMLYRYTRCRAVHNLQFPFSPHVRRVDGTVRYEDTHAITGPRLLETTQNILGNLSKECIGKSQWPWEL